jgi:hypothetical protein
MKLRKTCEGERIWKITDESVLRNSDIIFFAALHLYGPHLESFWHCLNIYFGWR